MINRPRTRSPRRPHRIVRRENTRPADKHLCNVCTCSCLSNETQSKAKSSFYANLDRVRKEITTEHVSYLYAQLKGNKMHTANELEKVMVMLFIEIATLQQTILELQTHLQTA